MQQQVIFPDQLKRRAKQELTAPQFVGFRCLACGATHADLKTLMACHEQKRAQSVAAVVVETSAAA